MASRSFAVQRWTVNLTWVLAVALLRSLPGKCLQCCKNGKHLVIKWRCIKSFWCSKFSLYLYETNHDEDNACSTLERHGCLLSVFHRVAPPILLCPITQRSLHTRAFVVKSQDSCEKRNVKRNHTKPNKDTLCFGPGRKKAKDSPGVNTTKDESIWHLVWKKISFSFHQC